MATPTMRENIARIGQDFAAFRARWPKAEARALNRTAATARTLLTRKIASDTRLKSSVVRDEIKVVQATPAKLIATLSISGKRIPLYDFGARGPQPSRGRGRGVTARLPGGAGRYEHAFIAKMRSGHVGVFQRASLTAGARKSAGAWSRNLPIYELYGPSLPKVFQKFVPEAQVEASATLAKNLAHELAFASGAIH